MIPETLQPWVVLLTTSGIFVTLTLTRRIPLDFLFMSGVLFLTITGIIEPSKAFAGFANPAVLTIGALLALTAALKSCGVIDWLGKRLLGNASTPAAALRRLGLTLLLTSPFILNTALVAMTLPMVIDWCHRHKVPASKLLIPISYFSILGGVCTLIGTSTTLVVQAQLNQYNLSNEQLEPLGFFEIGIIGLPCAIVGGIFLIMVGGRLLPDRSEPTDSFSDDQRDYLIEMLIRPDSNLIGKTVEEAGLRHLSGLFLFEIDRDDDLITPVEPGEKLQSGDRLIFTGAVETLTELEKFHGLVPAESVKFDLFDPGNKRYLTEIVLSRSSPLIGQSIRNAEFRQLYAAVVLAIHRNGKRLRGKIGDIVLQTGDTLLIQSKSKFAESYRNSREFSLVKPFGEYETRRHKKAWLAGVVIISMIVWLTVGNLMGAGSSWAYPPLVAITSLAFMVMLRCVRLSAARNALDIQMLLTIAFALGLGEAMSESGAADMIARQVSLVSSHIFLLVIVTYLLTMVLTEMISNTAVAAIMVPITLSVAEATSTDPRPLILAVAIAASLSFITPIGYQTNLMVMGPGGYRPLDYLRCGLPLSLLTAITALAAIWLFYF